jgi:transcription initiation factor IIE alpha subunit
MHKDLRHANWQEIRAYVASGRAKVYAALREHGPCTAKELAERMQWDKTSIRPRLTELCQAYHAQPTGERRNSEHVFTALSPEQAHALWLDSQPKIVTGELALAFA